MGQVTIYLPPELESRVYDQARVSGLSIEEVIATELEKALLPTVPETRVTARVAMADEAADLADQVPRLILDFLGEPAFQREVNTLSNASFERWLNAEVCLRIQSDLLSYSVRVERRYQELETRAWADIEIAAPGDGSTAPVYRIESKQVWDPGRWDNQTALALGDARRLAATTGGWILITVASSSSRSQAEVRQQWVRQRFSDEGWQPIGEGVAVATPAGVPGIFFDLYPVPTSQRL